MDAPTPKQQLFVDKRIKYPAYIYGIRPKGGEYFYVGSTAQTVKIRFRAHLSDVKAYRHTNHGFASAIREHGAENCEIDILEVTTVKKRFVREYAWLSKLEKQGVQLTNICKSVRQAEKIAESRKINQAVDREQLSSRFLNHVELALRMNDSASSFGFVTAIAHRPSTVLQIYA